MHDPCLKVDIDGTEILPKKYVSVKWTEEVQDNDERDVVRASESRAKEARDDDDEYEEVAEEEDADAGEDDGGLSQSVIMDYIKSLSEYGYNASDTYNLQKLSAAEWDDLARNTGIEPEHERHLMAALGIKRKVISKLKPFQ
jgi:hypothetical protein